MEDDGSTSKSYSHKHNLEKDNTHRTLPVFLFHQFQILESNQGWCTIVYNQLVAVFHWMVINVYQGEKRVHIWLGKGSPRTCNNFKYMFRPHILNRKHIHLDRFGDFSSITSLDGNHNQFIRFGIFINRHGEQTPYHIQLDGFWHFHKLHLEQKVYPLRWVLGFLSISSPNIPSISNYIGFGWFWGFSLFQCQYIHFRIFHFSPTNQQKNTSIPSSAPTTGASLRYQ